MRCLTIEILNPKVIKLLRHLQQLDLITISEQSSNPFLRAVKKQRAKKANLSNMDITKEVEVIRSKRSRKKAVGRH